MAKRRSEKNIKRVPIEDMKTAHQLVEALKGLTTVSQRMIQMLKNKVELYDFESLNCETVSPLRDMKSIKRVPVPSSTESSESVAKEESIPSPKAMPTDYGKSVKYHEISKLYQSICTNRKPEISSCSTTSTRSEKAGKILFSSFGSCDEQNIINEKSEKLLFSSFGSYNEQNNINDVAENHKKATERSAKDQNEEITRPKKRGRSRRKNKSNSQGYPSLNEKDNCNRTDSTSESYVLVKNIYSDPIAKSYKDECEQGSSLSGSSSKDNEDVVDDTEQSEAGDSYSHNESSISEFAEDQSSHNEKSGSESMEGYFNIDETKESDNENCTIEKDILHSSTVVKGPNTSEPEYNIEPGCSHVFSGCGNSNHDLYSDETDAATGNSEWDSYGASIIPESPVHDFDDCPETQSENVGKAEACAEFPNLNICASTSSKDPELELKPEMKEVVENALNTGTQEDRLVKTATEYLLRKDILTLDGLNWLNDKVINSYFELIMERSKKENYPSVHAFNTFFYKTYETKGYSKVKRWTEKLDIFRFDLNFVPIHSDIHWSLAVIDHRSKKICFYDSMNRLGKELALILEYISQEYKEKKCTSLGNYTIEVMENIPLQDNGSDCGMFMLKYAEFISRDAKVTFNQEHMQYFRKRMIYELLTKQLL